MLQFWCHRIGHDRFDFIIMETAVRPTLTQVCKEDGGVSLVYLSRKLYSTEENYITNKHDPLGFLPYNILYAIRKEERFRILLTATFSRILWQKTWLVWWKKCFMHIGILYLMPQLDCLFRTFSSIYRPFLDYKVLSRTTRPANNFVLWSLHSKELGRKIQSRISRLKWSFLTFLEIDGGCYTKKDSVFRLRCVCKSWNTTINPGSVAILHFQRRWFSFKNFIDAIRRW